MLSLVVSTAVPSHGHVHHVASSQVSLYKTTHLERFTCGCKCVRHGEFGCVEYDRETCGLMYSTAEQAPFCQVCLT